MSCHKKKCKCPVKATMDVVRYVPSILVISAGIAGGNLLLTVLGLALLNQVFDMQVLKNKIENTCWY